MKQQTLCLALVIAGCCAVPVAAQPRSDFNLKKVTTRLTDGTLIKGRILDATPDSLVMSTNSLSVINPYVPGNEITFRLQSVPIEYHGTVLDATDTVIFVRLDELPKETSTFYRRFVSSVKVTRVAGQERSNQLNRVAIHYSQIESVKLHRKGSGIMGFVGGFLFGSLIGGAAITSQPLLTKGAESSVAVGAIMIMVTPFIGMGLATSGKTRQVNGDQVKYEAFVKKVFPRGKRKP